MGDYISELPNDILCNIFSSLTVRDAFRVKSLSPSWKDLPDTRALLHFDPYTILGGESPVFGDNFVKGVEQFFKIWRAKKASELKIKYDLRSVSNSVIDGWILTAIGKEIEELDLDFSSCFLPLCGTYRLSCRLLDTGYLKHLRLTSCRLTMVCDASTRWLSKLHTLEMKYSPLCLRDVQCILSSTPNLESLILVLEWEVKTDQPLTIKHQSLKKLAFEFPSGGVELACPKLETFEFYGIGDVIFSKVPLLKEASLKIFFRFGGCLEDFTGLATNVPLLQTLSLWLSTEVKQPPPSVSMSCLKRLHLVVTKIRRCYFGIFTIVHYLDACPVLEELILRVESTSRMRLAEERWPVDRPHFHLKEVKFEGVSVDKISSTMAEYFLRSAVSLQQMVFVLRAKYDSVNKMHANCSMWQAINPTVKFVVELSDAQK